MHRAHHPRGALNPRTWRPRRGADPVAGRTWLSIRVDLIAGHGEALWPRPGRVFAASRSHTFTQLSTAIDDAFARWDRSHLWAFRFPEDLRIESGGPEWDDAPGEVLDGATDRLSRLTQGQPLVYAFDCV